MMSDILRRIEDGDHKSLIIAPSIPDVGLGVAMKAALGLRPDNPARSLDA